MRDLLILPFDHRGSFQEKLFGIRGRAPTPAETAEIASYKRIIYEAFKKALQAGVPRENAGILVDEQFGAEILEQARRDGFMTACPAEKSGQNEFDFEYGADFGAHITRFNPTFVKVLVRYNPEDETEMNRRQIQRLKQLSDYCQAHGNQLMLELLVVATRPQLERAQGSAARYDREFRPALMIQAMREMQDAGIEPKLWKLEGIESEADCRRIVAQAHAGGRDDVGVGVIVLGRGESDEMVRRWLSTAAHVPGYVGFAVGRTLFWEPLVGVKEGKWSREEAAEQIARNFKGVCDLWIQQRGQNSNSPTFCQSINNS